MTDAPTPPPTPAVDDAPDMSAQIAAESLPSSSAPQKPQGSPTLIPVSSLTRRQRADFFAQVRSFDLEALSQGADESSGGDLGVAASAFDAFAAMEDALRIVVIPGADNAYKAWAKNCSDEDVANLFAWYMQSFAPGEAQPSPTS